MPAFKEPTKKQTPAQTEIAIAKKEEPNAFYAPSESSDKIWKINGVYYKLGERTEPPMGPFGPMEDKGSPLVPLTDDEIKIRKLDGNKVATDQKSSVTSNSSELIDGPEKSPSGQYRFINSDASKGISFALFSQTDFSVSTFPIKQVENFFDSTLRDKGEGQIKIVDPRDEIKKNDQSSSVSSNQISLINYPNPFQTSTHFRFILPKEADIQLDVFNLRGDLVATVAKERHMAGPVEIGFNPTQRLFADSYLVRLLVDGVQAATAKIKVEY